MLSVNRKGINIGDKVNYEPETSISSYSLETNKSGYTSKQTINRENYIWKVLSINNDGTVDVMGVPTNVTQRIYLRGATGYNNGVYLLDEMCETLYSNTKLGIKARSIEIEDIEKKMNDKGIEARENEYYNEIARYGETKEFSGYYPKLAEYENHVGINSQTLNINGIGESHNGTGLEITIPLIEDDINNYSKSKKQADTIMVKQTFYYVMQQSNYYDDPNFFDLVFTTGKAFWLASRYTSPGGTGAYFGIRHVNGNYISGINLFRQTDTPLENNPSIVPVICIDTNIEMIKEKDGSWSLK